MRAPIPLTLLLLASPATVMAQERTSNDRSVEAVVKLIEEGYVFPDVAHKMAEAVRARAAKGEYRKLDGLAASPKLCICPAPGVEIGDHPQPINQAVLSV